jgi:UDP-GlcNAc3NAcA epimerase
LLERLNLGKENFVLATIHREANTDEISRLEAILRTIMALAAEYSIAFVMPLHPRTINSLRLKLENIYKELLNSKYIKIIAPVSYLEMTLLEKTSRMIITDSGGVQKESHFFKKPCLVLRKETEWIELVKNGTAVLVDADPGLIQSEFKRMLENSSAFDYPGFYGDGKAAEFILKEILMMFENA